MFPPWSRAPVCTWNVDFRTHWYYVRTHCVYRDRLDKHENIRDCTTTSNSTESSTKRFCTYSVSRIIFPVIRASLSEPHTYRTAVQNPPYRSTWSNLVPPRAPLNAQRANVGPASNDSKVNNITVKTATLVLCFIATDRLFQRSSWSNYE